MVARCVGAVDGLLLCRTGSGGHKACCPQSEAQKPWQAAAEDSAIRHSMSHKIMRWAITFSALGIAAIHAWWPELKLDGTTVVLLLVALLPWLQPLFKSLELPGGVKVEFQDLE